MTIDQLSFFGPDVTYDLPLSLPGLYLPVISSPPQVNYVVTCSMSTSIDNSISEVVHNVLGALDPNFQSVFLSSDEKLFEAMTSYSS